MDEVLEFIHRRFKTNCDWIDGNCYYFSLILKDRFPGGDIYYDVIDGHFLYLYHGNYYDWLGLAQPINYLVKWDDFGNYDSLQRERIIRDCLK